MERWVLSLWLLLGWPVLGQPLPGPTSTLSPASADRLDRSIPLGEVIFQSESVGAELDQMRQAVDGDGGLLSVQTRLREDTEQGDRLAVEAAKVLEGAPSLDNLRTLEDGLQPLKQRLRAAQDSLGPMLEACEKAVSRLIEMQEVWRQTLAGSSRQSSPEEVLQRIRATQDGILTTRNYVEQRQKQLLSLQNRVALEKTRVEQALSRVEMTRQQAVDRLFYQDSLPLWQARALQSGEPSLLPAVESSGRRQVSELSDYARQNSERFWIHGLLVGALWALAGWARGTVATWAQTEPTLQRVAAVFERPLAMAILLSLSLSGWLYPQIPPMGLALLGAAALLPTILILRRLVEPQLFPILHVLVVFYLVDQLRLIAAAVPVLARILFLLQMIAGLVFCLFVWRRNSKLPLALLGVGLRLGMLFFLASSVATVLGYLNLAYLGGNAVLRSAYLALILYAGVRVVDGLLLLTLRIRPLCLLASVRTHRLWLRQRVHSYVRWAAVLLWLLSFLEMLSQRSRVLEGLGAFWDAGLRIGALRVTVGSLIAFAAILWGAALFSRLLSFLLQEDVYPRMQLARGVPYAITTTSHYLILLLGFLLAMAAAGIDMTRFTILAGAFSVGLGFGLQNIVNNFVSGLILLFERPVKLGDFVQIGELSGRVERIGIRASVVRTLTSAEVIVPNSKLISDSVTNWTLSSRQRGIEIPVAVGCESDPLKVQRLLLEVARSHPQVSSEPPPAANLVEFGADTLNFELLAYTDVYEQWIQTRSELMMAILLKFSQEGISMPFPQRDIHLYATPRVGEQQS